PPAALHPASEGFHPPRRGGRGQDDLVEGVEVGQVAGFHRERGWSEEREAATERRVKLLYAWHVFCIFIDLTPPSRSTMPSPLRHGLNKVIFPLRMQPRLLLLPGIVLAMTGLPLAAQESQPDAAVVELRETIARIVDTRALESKERQDWEARKNSMATLLDLHRSELELLDEELEKAGQSAGGYDGKKREAEAEIAALREARRTAAEAVARNRPRALALAKRFPAPLADETETERVTLEDWKPGGEP